MKRLKLIVLLLPLITALVALLIWLNHTKHTSEQNANYDEEPALRSIKAATNIAPQTTASDKTSLSYQSKPLAFKSRTELYRDIFNANDADIIFFGHLEDQFNKGVPGADVSFSIQYENATKSGTIDGKVVSDQNGFFVISGYKGATLVIMPAKPGYAVSTTDTSFRYTQISPGYFIPDASNPTIIKMHKLIGAEPLVSINKTFKIPYTSDPILLDLISGSVVSNGGDLEIIVYRTNGIISPRIHGDWSIKLIPVDGGIKEPEYNTSYVTFQAPENGYQDSLFVTMSHDDPKWFENIQKAFFLKSRNGQIYSKVLLNFDLNHSSNTPMRFQFKGVANTNFSRNWEATAPQ